MLDALERACTARLVEEVAGTIGRYSFVHALTREALYDSLGATRRARLHRRVAEAIESRYTDDLEDHFGALAFHYAAAGTDVPKAVEYAGLAGDQALARLAHEDAARQFERGLDLLAEQDRARCDLLLGLAEARRRAGDVPGSQTAFAEAGNLARALGDAERLARAAVGSFRGHVMASPGWHDPVIALLEDALELLPAEDSGLRSRVLAALVTRALLHARSSCAASPSALKPSPWRGGSATTTHLRSRSPTRTRHCTTPGTSMPGSPCRPSSSPSASASATPSSRTSVTCIARATFSSSRVSTTLRRSARAAAEIVEDLGQPMQRYFVIWLESTLALLEGRFDDAQRLSDEALDIGIAADHPDAFVVWGTQALVLGWQRGEVAHLVEPAQQLLEQFPDLTAWPAAVALTEVLAGLHDEARARLHAYTADLDVLDFGAIWVPALVALTEVCRIVDAPECAAPIYERLVPYAQTLCVVSLNLSEMGPVSRSLGVLASLMGDYARAELHFADALATSERIGAPPHVARTSADYARMLLSRGAAGDHERAQALLTQARSIAERIGQGGVLADVAGLAEQPAEA